MSLDGPGATLATPKSVKLVVDDMEIRRMAPEEVELALDWAAAVAAPGVMASLRTEGSDHHGHRQARSEACHHHADAGDPICVLRNNPEFQLEFERQIERQQQR